MGIVVNMFWFVVQGMVLLLCLILIVYIAGYIMDYAYRD